MRYKPVMFAIKLIVIVNVLAVVSSVRSVPKEENERKEENGRVVFPTDLFIRTEHHHHHPPHNHNVHNHGGGGQLTWDDRSQDRRKQEEPPGGSDPDRNKPVKGIPLDFAKHINEFNVSDLLLNYVDGEDEYDEPTLLNRFAGADTGEERNARAQMPESARCMPELKTVELAPANSDFFYIPQCTRVERCGGCCTHKLLECQPVETESINYKLIKTQYVDDNGTKKLKYMGKELVPIEKHTKCKCGCKTKAAVSRLDCNAYQEYREGQCSCICTNYDEMKKCNKEYAKKVWDPDICVCKCKEILPCSTGYNFDLQECRCMAAPVRRRYANYEKEEGYNYDSVPIEGLPQNE